MTDNGTAPANDPPVNETQLKPREDRPWGIRAIDPDAIDNAVGAAKRQRMTVGEWLAIAIRRQVAHEREAGFGTHPLEVEGELFGPHEQLPALRDHPDFADDTVEQLRELRALIKESGELRRNGKPNEKLVTLYEDRLRRLLMRCTLPASAIVELAAAHFL